MTSEVPGYDEWYDKEVAGLLFVWCLEKNSSEETFAWQGFCKKAWQAAYAAGRRAGIEEAAKVAEGAKTDNTNRGHDRRWKVATEIVAGIRALAEKEHKGENT